MAGKLSKYIFMEGIHINALLVADG